MARHKLFAKREVLPDSRFNDKLVSRLIGLVLRKGKRSTAETICYKAMDRIKEVMQAEPLDVLKTALEHVKPFVEVKSRRVGGASYQVPVEVRPDRRIAVGFRWMIFYAKQRSQKSMAEKLAGEIMDAYNNTGGAVKKREDTHRMAEANKAFAHYRW